MNNLDRVEVALAAPHSRRCSHRHAGNSHRRALRARGGASMALLAAALLCPAAGHAHDSPGVRAIVDQDQTGPLVLRLNQGLARRDAGQWHFVCSALYQGRGQDLAGSLPGGGVAIASSVGVWLMKRDGTVAPHPDPAAAEGNVTGFARSPTTLFALRARQDLYEVLEVDADRVRVLWTDSNVWSDIAVGSSFLQLVRFGQDEVEELHLSLQGQVLSQQKAPLVDALEVTARVIADEPYSGAKFQSSMAQLGRLEQGAWRALQTASGNLAGPIQNADGSRFIALEGKLAAFDAEVVTPRADSDFIVGLGRLDDRSYACTVTGLRELSSAGLGATLFDLAQLQPPDPCAVPEAQRSACNLEWQHFRFELLAVNIPLVTPAVPATECSSAPATLPAPTAGAGATLPAAAGSPATGTPPAASSSVPAPPSGSRAGCSLARGPLDRSPPLGLAMFAIACAALRRPARRRPP